MKPPKVCPLDIQDDFIGRDEEMRSFEFSLKLCNYKDPQFRNFYIIGQKGVGKTSFLRMCKVIAENNGSLVADIHLTNECIHNDILLFKIILNDLLTTDKRNEIYGEFGESVRRLFRIVPEKIDIKLFPLLFCEVYASWSQGLQKDQNLLPGDLIRDLNELFQKAAVQKIKSIVLIFDDSDNFIEHIASIELIKEIFQHVNGYNLVFSATKDLGKNIRNLNPVKIKLKNFEFDDVKDYFTMLLDENEKKEIDANICKEIHTLTLGYPRLVSLLTLNIYQECCTSGKIHISIDVLKRYCSQLEVQCIDDQSCYNVQKEVSSYIHAITPEIINEVIKNAATKAS